MRVAPENIFPGAKIKLGNEMFYVIKVNSKSFYASKESFQDFMEGFRKKLKGVTFTAYCKQNDVKMYKYSEPFEIEENEFSRRLVAVENTKNTFEIESHEKNAIIDCIKEFKKKKKDIRLTMLTYNKSKIFFLEENGNSYLANINKNYILFSLDTDEWIKISTVYDFKDKFDHVPWEKLSVFASAKMTA